MLQISGLSKFLLLILLVYLVLSIFFGFPKVTGLLIKSIWQAGKSIVVILDTFLDSCFGQSLEDH